MFVFYTLTITVILGTFIYLAREINNNGMTPAFFAASFVLALEFLFLMVGSFLILSF